MREHSRVQSYRSRKIVVYNVINEDTTQHNWKQYNKSRHNGT